jgi:hypothetical protein
VAVDVTNAEMGSQEQEYINTISDVCLSLVANSKQFILKEFFYKYITTYYKKFI